MTADELRILFNDSFGLSRWPETYDVDHETFANVCDSVFKDYIRLPQRVGIALGIHGGIMFKGVEILLQRDE